MSMSNPKAAFGGAAVLALTLHATAAHASPEKPGYTPDLQPNASALPIHLVVEQSKVRPQIAYGYVTTPYPTQTYPGMSFGQGLGVNLAGGLIASAIINGAEYAKAKNFARGPYGLMVDTNCDLPVDQAIPTRVDSAIRTAWPQTAPQTHVLAEDAKLKDVVDTRSPRYVFRVSTSLAPDFSALMTTVEAAAYPPNATTGKSDAKPAWQDTVIVVSDKLMLAPKTPADIESMVAAENARHAALNINALIAQANSEGPSSRARKKVVDAQNEHRTRLKEARLPVWSPASEAEMRARMWSADQCQALVAAIDANATETGAALTALFTGAVKQQVPDAQPAEAEAAGQRRLEALSGGFIVSHRIGDNVGLGFRESILSD